MSTKKFSKRDNEHIQISLLSIFTFLNRMANLYLENDEFGFFEDQIEASMVKERLAERSYISTMVAYFNWSKLFSTSIFLKLFLKAEDINEEGPISNDLKFIRKFFSKEIKIYILMEK